MPQGVPSTNYGGVWAYGYIGYSWGTSYHRFNNHDNAGTVYEAFRSQHPGGGNFALADGSVRFFAETFEHATYQALAPRAGSEWSPNTNVLTAAGHRLDASIFEPTALASGSSRCRTGRACN